MQNIPEDEKFVMPKALQKDEAPKNPFEPIIQFFEYTHLPAHLQEVSKPFGELALQIVGNLPRNPERTVALRKLLESKDAAVRSKLMKS